MNKLTSSIPIIPFLETGKDPLPVSKEDLYLCANGLFALGSSTLENMGYSSWALRSVSTLTNMMGTIGESVTSVKTFKDANAAALGVALAGVRILAFNKMHAYPALRPMLLVINAYGTYAVVQRAYRELRKCYETKKANPEGELNWNIARNVFIHGVNASYSIYRTFDFLHPKSKATNESPRFRAERKKTLAGITRLMDPNSNARNLNGELLACRTLYYDTSCLSLHNAQSDCAPTCQDLSEKQINDQYSAMLTKTYFDNPKSAAQKVYVYIEKAKDILLKAVQERKKQAQIKQRQLTATKQAVREADSIIETFDLTKKVLSPHAHRVIKGIRDGKPDSTRASSIKAFNDHCKAIATSLHADKNPLATQSERLRLHKANTMINGACDEIRDLDASNNQVRRIIDLRAKESSLASLACKIYDIFCALLKQELPSISVENAKTKLTSQNLVEEINGSWKDRISQWLRGTKDLHAYRRGVLDSLAALEANSQNLQSKISDMTDRFALLEEGLEDLTHGPLLSQVAKSKNPFTQHPAQTATRLVEQAKPILGRKYDSVTQGLSKQILNLENLKLDLDYLYSQLDRIRKKQGW